VRGRLAAGLAATGHPNAAVAGVGGAVTILIVWALGLFAVPVPSYVGSAITTVVTFLLLVLPGRATTSARPDPGDAPAPPGQP
jgi:hypothetical protein